MWKSRRQCVCELSWGNFRHMEHVFVRFSCFSVLWFIPRQHGCPNIGSVRVERSGRGAFRPIAAGSGEEVGKGALARTESSCRANILLLLCKYIDLQYICFRAYSIVPLLRQYVFHAVEPILFSCSVISTGRACRIE